MDIKEFTKQTLVQVVEGIQDANVILAEKNSKVNTCTRRGINGNIYTSPIAINVDFDIAVTASETERGSGEASLKVASIFNAGGNLNRETENQTISRVKYTLQLTYNGK